MTKNPATKKAHTVSIMPQEVEIPGIIVNVHNDWDSLIRSITHQPTFQIYEDHIDNVIDEALRVLHNRQALNEELAAIEEAVTAAPNTPVVAQMFYVFRQSILDFNDFLHQHQGEAFGLIRQQFDDFWPYDEA